MDIYSPFLSSSYTFGIVQSSGMDGSNLFGSKGIFIHKNAEQINGLRLAPQAPVTITSLVVNFYGLKEE